MNFLKQRRYPNGLSSRKEEKKRGFLGRMKKGLNASTGLEKYRFILGIGFIFEQNIERIRGKAGEDGERIKVTASGSKKRETKNTGKGDTLKKILTVI